MRNGESQYVLMKKEIVHATTAKITMTISNYEVNKIYLIITNVLVEILVIVHN